jgi:hypothetical protein
MKNLIATTLVLGLASCFGPQVKIEKIDPNLNATVEVSEDKSLLQTQGITILGVVEATSCKNLITDPEPTMQQCVAQMQTRTGKLGGNLLVVGSTSRDTADFLPGGSGINRNCWVTIDCQGIAAIKKN